MPECRRTPRAEVACGCARRWGGYRAPPQSAGRDYSPSAILLGDDPSGMRRAIIDAKSQLRGHCVDDKHAIAHRTIDQPFLAALIDGVHGRKRNLFRPDDIGMDAIISHLAGIEPMIAAKPIFPFHLVGFAASSKWSGLGCRKGEA